MNITPNMGLLLMAILADVKRLESMPDLPNHGMDLDDWRARLGPAAFVWIVVVRSSAMDHLGQQKRAVKW